MDRCEIPRCRGESYVNYFGHLVCERHWDRMTADDALPTLKEVLGIPTAPVAAMEEPMEPTISKSSSKAEAPAEATSPKKSKAPKKEKVTKEAKPKREKVENPVVFAFRLSEAERTRIHEAAGSGKASQFVLTAALAAAEKVLTNRATK